MKKIIHVNRTNIQRNHTTLHLKEGEVLPVFDIITEEQTLHTNGIVIKHDGVPVVKLIYSPKTPLPNGTRAYIQLTENAEIEIDTIREKED